jgi:hypothetical protein
MVRAVVGQTVRDSRIGEAVREIQAAKSAQLNRCIEIIVSDDSGNIAPRCVNSTRFSEREAGRRGSANPGYSR